MRTIREEKRVEQRIDEVRGKLPRVEEIYEGWKWRLARAPELGYRMSGVTPDTYLALSVPEAPDHPSLLFIYRFDDQYVTIIDLVITPAETN